MQGSGALERISRLRGRLWAGFVLLLATLVPGSANGAIKVAASISPLHSLVAGVMYGLGEPTLLIRGGASPHLYSLRPSDARALEAADLVFWIGEALETSLEKSLVALTAKARIVEVARLPGIELLDSREGGAWDAQGHEVEAEEEHGLDGYNPHLWLDPHNADQIVRAAIRALSAADPDNSRRYEANGRSVLARLSELTADLTELLAPIEQRRYVVYHDAYPYLERRFGLSPAGSITLSPDRAPGARRLTEIRRRILELDATCVFSEPQFEPALVEVLVEGTAAKTGVLDPLAAEIAPGPDAYFAMMRALARSLLACLTPAS